MENTNKKKRNLRVSKIVISMSLIVYLILLLYPTVELLWHLITINSKIENKEYIKPFINIGLSKYMYSVYSKDTIFYFLARQMRLLQYSVPIIIFLLFLINKNDFQEVIQRTTKLSSIIVLRLNLLNDIPNKDVYEFCFFVLSFIITISYVHLNYNRGFIISFLTTLWLQLGFFYLLQILFLLFVYFFGVFNNRKVYYLLLINSIFLILIELGPLQNDIDYFYVGNMPEMNNILFGLQCSNLIKEVLETCSGSFYLKIFRGLVVDSFNTSWTKYFPFISSSCIYLATPTLNFIFGGFRGVILHQLQHVIDNNSLNFNILYNCIPWPNLIVLSVQILFILLCLWHLENLSDVSDGHKLLLRIIFVVLVLFSRVFRPVEIFCVNVFKINQEIKADLYAFKGNHGRDLLVFISVILNIFNNEVVCGPMSLYTTCFIDYHPTLDKRVKNYIYFEKNKPKY